MDAIGLSEIAAGAGASVSEAESRIACRASGKYQSLSGKPGLFCS
jgi:hypothetical protein